MKNKLIKLASYLRLNNFLSESDYILKFAAYSEADIQRDFPQLHSAFFPKGEVLDDKQINIVGQIFRQIKLQVDNEKISFEDVLSLNNIDEIKSKLAELREDDKKFKNKKDLTKDMIYFIKENGISKKDLDFVYNPEKRMNHQLFDALIEVPKLNSMISRIKSSGEHADSIENNIYDYPNLDEAIFKIRSIDTLVREGLDSVSEGKVKNKLKKYYDYIYEGKMHEGKDYSRYEDDAKGRAKETSKILSQDSTHICVHSWSKEACQYWEQGAVKIRKEGPEFRTCTSRIRGVEGWTNLNLFDTYSEEYIFQLIKPPLRPDLSDPNDMITICFDKDGDLLEFGGETVNAENKDLDRDDIISAFPIFEELEPFIKKRIGIIEEKCDEIVSLMREGGDLDQINDLYNNFALKTTRSFVKDMVNRATSYNRDYLISFQDFFNKNISFKEDVLKAIYPSKEHVMDDFRIITEVDSVIANIFHDPHVYPILGIPKINELYNKAFRDYLEFLKDFYNSSNGHIGSVHFETLKKQVESFHINTPEKEVKDMIDYFIKDVSKFLRLTPVIYDDSNSFGYFLDKYYNYSEDPASFLRERFRLSDILREPKPLYLYMRDYDKECFKGFKDYVLNARIEDDWKVVEEVLSSFESNITNSLKVFIENKEDALNFLKRRPELCYRIFEKRTNMSIFFKKLNVDLNDDEIKNILNVKYENDIKSKYKQYIQDAEDQINNLLSNANIDRIVQDYADGSIQISIIEDLEAIAEQHEPGLISKLNEIYKNNFKNFSRFEKWLRGHSLIPRSREKEVYSQIPILFRMSDPSVGAGYQILKYLTGKHPGFSLS